MSDVFKKLIVAIFILFECSFSYLQGQTEVSISQIQGVGNFSSFNGQIIRTNDNIVSGVGSGFFFIQSSAANEDSEISSSEGLLVYANQSQIPTSGDIVNIVAEVDELNSNTVLYASQINVLSVSPENLIAVQLSNEFPSGINNSINDLERVENSVVSFNKIWVNSPSNDDGRVFISSKNERPRREPGVEFPAGSSLLEWDGNPELIELIPHAFGGAKNFDLLGGSKISGRGIIVQDGSRYQLWPLELNIENRVFETLPEASMEEITIANLNLLRFFRSDFNYELRLKKLAEHVVNKLHSPDILAFQEVGGQNEMEDLRDAILDLNANSIYKVWFENSSGDISNAFLSRSTISEIQVSQLGEFETLSIGGRKHDRPPLLLSAKVNTSQKQEINILNLHQRSLNGIEGSNSNFVRAKRNEQAVSVMNMVDDLNDENLIVLGDFNAYEFSDGYVDVVNQIRGEIGLMSQFSIQTTLDVPLKNISEEFSTAAERYSFIFNGNTKMIDHCLSNELIDLEIADFQFTRGNADSPAAYLSEDNGLRISDHDGFMLYLDVGEKPVLMDISIPLEKEIAYPNPFKTNSRIRLNLQEKDNLNVELFDLGGRLVTQKSLSVFDAGDIQLEGLEYLPAGIYILKIDGRNFQHTGKLVLVQ